MINKYSTENSERANELIALLTNWYETNSRDLVWRKTQEPYAIWICEIMAQQTRITAVLPYYERFMAQFPTVEVLANASIDAVLKAWEGLGYYSRAHNILKTANIIVQQYGGHFPSQLALLTALPGIGEYTAGAIASICFNQPVPAIDGNVLRVFARLENNDMDISLPITKKLLTAYVRNLMPGANAGIFNQALMELGALVCIPKNPLCSKCPLTSLCIAYRENNQQELPVKAAKKQLKMMNKTILVIENPHQEILVRQRDEKLLKGLWEFYMLDGHLSTEDMKNHVQQVGYTADSFASIGEATHVFTHIKWYMQGYACKIKEQLPPAGYEFISMEEMKKRAMPTALEFYRKWLLGEDIEQIALDSMGI